jgi:DNA-binding Lrp family transcriptional regulator
MDDIDVAIVAGLQRDARAPYSRLARKLELNETTVRKRVERLIERRQIQFHLSVADSADEIATQAIVEVQLRPDCIARVAEVLSSKPEVRYVGMGGGTPEMWLGVATSGPGELYEFLTGTLAGIDGVIRFESHEILRVVKGSSSW